ncbi:hypothetical protein EDC04DRAFT_3141665 [Pisolithus marmoratus]|nr:hypothetical protein EDC04DRAFT_3141665 [Pisolithus marmoratus]
MDYLPELAHDGHNWTAYGSLVLCTIIDDGLMGFLVGSETRPIHPAQQYGRGEGWTPQTDNERDEVAAWKAADQSWTQRNAMVNYTIVSGIPDTIFGCMLHLKSPLEKWDYLEKRFGSILRPESWVAAEEAMRQSDSQPEQSTAGETTQSTHNSHDKPSNPPSEEADSPDGPNDCAETKSRYLTPETEVVDAQQIELYLPVVEVGTVNSKQPDERDHTGVASTSIPANIVAAKQPTVVLHKRTEIAYGPMAPEATIVDVQSQVAGSCAANSNEREGDRTEIPAGYLKPEVEIIDVRQVDDNQPVAKVGVTDANRPNEHACTLEVPDERSQRTDDNTAERRDLPEASSEALETPGDLPFATSERAETWTGHRKPEDKVVDTRHVVDVLPMFEVGSTGQVRYSKHVKELQASDGGNRRASDEVEESRDLPKSSSEVPKPAGNPTRRASRRTMQDRPLIPSEENQRTRTNSETVANVPDPPGTYAELPALHAKCSTLQNKPPAQVHSRMVTELRLPCTRSKQASQHPQQTRRRRSTWDTPPDEVWGVGAHMLARTGRGDSTDVRSTSTELEIRAHVPQLERRPTAPDKGRAGTSRFDNAVSRDPADSQRVEKPLLAHNRSQYTRREAKRLNRLPVSPTQPPNGITDTPRTSRVPHRHCRVNTTPVNVRGLKTRGYRRLILNIPVSLPCEVSQHLWNIADTFRRQDMPHRRTRKRTGPSDSRMAVSQRQHETTRQDGKHAWLEQHGTRVLLWNLPWEQTEWNNSGSSDATSNSAICSRGAEKKLLADSGSQHAGHEAQRQDNLPAMPEPPLTSIPNLPQPYRLLRRCGRIKQTAGSVSDVHTRRDAYSTQAAPTRPPLSLFRPTKRLRYPMGWYQMMKKGYNEISRHSHAAVSNPLEAH